MELARAVDALGSFGYFRGGPDVAVKGLAEGFDQRYFDRAAEFRTEYEEVLTSFLKSIDIKQSAHLNWFTVGEHFNQMGVKTVGLICEHIRDNEISDTGKYIAGFQPIPDKIPGLGPVQFGEVKVSMRVPPALMEQVDAGAMPALTDFLPQGAQKLGGFVDACHRHAAAVTVPHGSEAELVATMEELLV